MRAGVLWVVMVCLSDGKVPTCSVEQAITVSKHSKVSVSCPSVLAKMTDVNFQLDFNNNCISKINLNKPSDYPQSLFSGQFEVTANSSGAYVCRRTVDYPPPSTEECHITNITVRENQSLHPINDTIRAASQSCAVRPPFIPEVVMWTGCCFLLVYSLTITCVAIALWWKMKRNEEEPNEYINTKPGEVRKPYKA